MTRRALVLGEALIDIVASDGRTASHPGGSPLNVAVGLARLGVSTTLHSRFGMDAAGQLIQDHLAASNVAVTSETVTSAPTSFARANIMGDGSASYDFSITWDPAPVRSGGFDLVHTGSIATAIEPGADVLERALSDLGEHVLVSYDPNVRAALMGDHADALRRVERFVALSDVVKASDDDIHWLYPGRSIPWVLNRWLELGASFAVATLGAKGATSATSAGTADVPAPSITVADTIGSGDSFMSGLLFALVEDHWDDGARLRDATSETQAGLLAVAAKCAAITTTREGADPPTHAELLAG